MKLRHAAPLLLVPLAALAGCRKKPRTNPEPYTSTSVTNGSDTDRARADSIAAANEAAARAERERLDRDRRAREAAVSTAREALTDIVFFQYDSDEITAEAERKLQTKASVLQSNPAVRLRIEGHCDQRGSTEYNLALGQRRAEAVRAYLVNLGIDGSRLATISYGKERPLEEGEDEDALARNRRAEFTVAGGEITTVPAELRR
ncbi:peptidoglycan-associated lipoprotein Pal [Longimicrobium sp.]|uniref:peptidoglycan-associated lipoprotein Pal n=1 Tax=Longimicrobium sp. TaxID=2029185 RepID=UPI002C3B71DB|nr:peptidoglycan-associated lipoprotein Pal [Longimicrobium sp.]HSU13361.1 peptidoglycan-associated lipoprotein Pal [Longimicrobium sp.]